ncbi:flagellar filament capping protein FliD [Janthinobacterium fluminis]|uniref:Flagellar hook-associated protein 2 n=1 Tax=Janthinobacterium fluminis TaxID=2987524 RepID=A0ABT5JVR4_9BURK|nr:flagellar filament capping protein FliD [Janthinobacterium fluminis]MDC8756280.1 flagellar filament capping protein FliD [Janthinobacterium fluminis]
MFGSPINNRNNPYNAGAPQGGVSADVYARVEKVMSSQNKGVLKLNNALARDQIKLSGLGQLQNALASFQGVAQGMSGSGLATSATSSAKGVLGAATTSKAAAGTYAVDVQQLARGQTLTSAGRASADAVIGTGAPATIKVEFGSSDGKTFTPGEEKAKTITIKSGNNTLQGIAAAFKEAGIDAQVIKGEGGYALALNGQSGAAASMRISVGGDAAVSDLLAYKPGATKGMVQTAAAQDALLTVNGKAVTSASNSVATAIDGVTLSLAGKGSSSVVVARDTSQIASNVAGLVSAYNSLNTKIQSLKEGELKSGAAAQAGNQLAQVLTSGSNGVPKSVLAEAGITMGKNGELLLDEKKLKSAIAADPDAVSKLFTNNGQGVADQFATKIAALTGESGVVKKEAASVGKEITALTNKKAVMAKALTAQANALAQLYSQQAGAGAGGGRSLFDFMA